MTAVPHFARVLRSPVPGVFATYSCGGLQFGRHWHDVYGFGVIDQGAQSWASARGRVNAYAGDVIDTNPGEVHDGRPHGGPSRRWRIVSVDADAMRALAGVDGEPGAITAPVINDARLGRTLVRLFATLDRWQARGDDVTAMAFEERLVESCAQLLSRHGTTPPGAHAVDDVRMLRDRLADEWRNPPSLEEMAALTGVSRFQVLRRFRAQFGLPPHAWVRCRRTEVARALIGRGVPLARAAASSGFADQSHMTRAFARQYGYTPGAWRRAMLQ